MTLYDRNLNQSESIDELRGLLRDSEDNAEELKAQMRSGRVTSEQVSNHEMFQELNTKHLALQDDYKKLIKEKADLDFEVKFANRKVKSLTNQLSEVSNKKQRTKPEPSMKRVSL